MPKLKNFLNIFVIVYLITACLATFALASETDIIPEIDTIAPEVQIYPNYLNNGSTLANNTITITASDTSGIKKISYKLNTDAAYKDASITSLPTSAKMSVNITATPGTYTIFANATDANDNTSATAEATFSIPDTTAPKVTILPSKDILLPTDIITISAIDDAGIAKISYKLDSASTYTDISSSTFQIPGFTPGTHTIYARATDTSGNTSSDTSATFTVNAIETTPIINTKPTADSTPTANATDTAPNVNTVDTTPPEIRISPNGGNILTTDTITISASDASGIEKISYKLDSASTYTDISASTFKMPSLTSGSHILYAKATDKNKNTSTAMKVDFTVTAPNTPITAINTDSTTNTSTGIIQVKTDENGIAQINSSAIDEAIKNLDGTGTNDSKIIDISIIQTAQQNRNQINQNLQADLPTGIFETMQKNDISGVSLNFGSAKLTVKPNITDIDAIKELKQQSQDVTVNFRVEEVKTEVKEAITKNISKEIRLINNAPIIKLSASAINTSTGTEISLNDNLGKGVAVDIPLGNIDLSQLDTSKLSALVYIEDINQLENPKNTSQLYTWQPVGGKYDPASNSFKFTRKTFSMYTIMQINKGFSDLEQCSWAKKEIETMAAKGFIAGNTANTFNPSANITRAEFTSIIVKTLGLMDKRATANFSDVKPNDWYYTAVASAFKEGLIAGKRGNAFCPNSYITREEMMAIIANAMTKTLGMEAPENTDSILNMYNDNNKIAPWAKKGVAFSINQKLVTGKSQKIIAPKDNASRAETAVIAKRLYDLL